MWLLWIIAGIAIAVALFVYGSRDLCPRCGIKLADEFGAPGTKVGYLPVRLARGHAAVSGQRTVKERPEPDS